MSTEILRSGGVYVVVRGGLARVWSESRGKVSAAAPVGSVMAHVHVDAPWEPVAAGDAPGPVRDAAVSEDGWEPPAWARGGPR